VEDVHVLSLVLVLPIRYAGKIRWQYRKVRWLRYQYGRSMSCLTWSEPTRFLHTYIPMIWTVTGQPSRPAPIHDSHELLSYPASNVSALCPDTAQFSNSKILPPFGATVSMLAPEPSIPCCSCML
jgi:hypothetical protein